MCKINNYGNGIGKRNFEIRTCGYGAGNIAKHSPQQDDIPQRCSIIIFFTILEKETTTFKTAFVHQ
jgi:hypothetical protein